MKLMKVHFLQMHYWFQHLGPYLGGHEADTDASIVERNTPVLICPVAKRTAPNTHPHNTNARTFGLNAAFVHAHAEMIGDDRFSFAADLPGLGDYLAAVEFHQDGELVTALFRFSL